MTKIVSTIYFKNYYIPIEENTFFNEIEYNIILY